MNNYGSNLDVIVNNEIKIEKINQNTNNNYFIIVVSETMLIDGINHGNEYEKIADFLLHLKRLDKAYVAIPTRYPTEKWVEPAKEETVNTAIQVFSKKLGANRIECLRGCETNAFALTGNVPRV